MGKIKLVNGIEIEVTNVELVNGTLNISTTESTVEELHNIFANKENTSLITLLTDSGVESGYKTGFTSFAGITYDAEGVKTISLFQPKDTIEARLSNAEGRVGVAEKELSQVEAKVSNAETGLTQVEESISSLQEAVDILVLESLGVEA